MKLKFLYALALFLCLSTFASSNECTRHCPKTTAPRVQPVPGNQPDAASAAATEKEQEDQADYSPFPLVRLLYI
jgi:hypothetical protein